METTSAHQKIAVTGASGFVGRYLVKELLDAGKQVVAVVRNPNKVPELKRAGIELRVADLSDTAAMTQAFFGCDAVIANAGQVSFNRDYDALIRQNLEGTKNTLQACKDAGVTRVVAMSSASVYQKVFADLVVIGNGGLPVLVEGKPYQGFVAENTNRLHASICKQRLRAFIIHPEQGHHHRIVVIHDRHLHIPL